MAIAEDMVLTHADIPKAEYYVCCNDSFMSGWDLGDEPSALSLG